jgi:hypothetical protein
VALQGAGQPCGLHDEQRQVLLMQVCPQVSEREDEKYFIAGQLESLNSNSTSSTGQAALQVYRDLPLLSCTAVNASEGGP